MMLCNNTSRYDVAIAAIRGGAQVNPKVAVDAHTAISGLRHEAQKARDYVFEHGKGKTPFFVPSLWDESPDV